MKFTAAVLVAAAGAAAHSNVTYVTEVVESYVTYCPAPTTISHGSQTWTVTEPTTLTITDCPCTLTKPVLTTSAVECHDCPKPTTEVYQPPPPATTSAVVVVPSVPVYSSAVVPSAPATVYPVPPPAQPTAPQQNTTVPVPTPGPVTPPQSGAAKVAGFSGIFGVVAIAAFFL